MVMINGNGMKRKVLPKSPTMVAEANEVVGACSVGSGILGDSKYQGGHHL